MGWSNLEGNFNDMGVRGFIPTGPAPLECTQQFTPQRRALMRRLIRVELTIDS
jgi:hypothetical protein